MRPVVLKTDSTPSIGDVITWDGIAWVPEGPRARPHDTLFVNTKSIVHIVQGPYQSPDFVSGSAGWQFDADGSLEANNIIARGTIYANAGEIGGFTIASNNLYAGTGSDRVGLAPGTYPFYAGHETPSSAPFRVTKDGSFVATNATITGSITATTGAIGGWDIAATEIKSGAGIVLDSSVPSIVIGAGGYIRSSNYVSGFDGFHIDDDFAEFGNVQVRGSLHCAVFVKDLISAHAGSLLVTKSAGKMSSDYTTGGTLVVKTPPGGGWLFDSGDIIRIKEEYASGVHESWVTVTRTGTTNQYTTVLSNGDSTTYHCGTTAVDYGQSGDGGLLQTADMANAPWLSVFTHAGAPWTTLTHHLRLGNLNGVGGYSSDKYGVFIGDYAGDKWMSYDPTNSLRIRGDALIDGTVTAEKLYMGIGDNIFNAADGLLLLGPGCEITDAKWQSLRGQATVITGALHQEAGRWQGTRALVIEPAATNYITNPRMYDGNANGMADSWSPWDNLGSGGTPTYTVGAHTDPRKGWLQRVVYTGTAGDMNDTVYVLFRTTAASFAAGDAATAHFVIKGAAPDVTVLLELQAENAANANLGAQTTEVTLTDTLQQVVVNYATLPANTDHVRVALVILSIYDGDSINLYFGEAQVEKTAAPTSFIAGSLGHEYAWTGADDASTSTRAVTKVILDSLAGLVSQKNTTSFRLMAQAPYDADATWVNTTHNILMDYYGPAQRVYLTYLKDSNRNKFRLHVNGTDAESAVQTFKAGDWLDLVLTLDFTNDEYIVYLNGEEIINDDTAATSNAVTDWALGSLYTGTSYQCWTLAEYATFDKVLTPTEVAAIYALQRPLVDTGAMGSPGIYILDGKFKMASSLTGQHVDIAPEGVGIYGGTGPTGVARLLGGQVNTTTKVLESGGDSLGWFGYDDSNVLQVAWYASGSRKGEITAGAGAIRLKSTGKETHGTGDADIYDKWYNTDITVYTTAFGFANLQKTDPTPNTYGRMNFGIRHNATNQSTVSCWLNEVDLVIQKAGAWREVFQANYDFVKVEGVPFRVAVLGADPTVGIINGMLFYHTGTHKLRLRANGAWVNLN